MFIAKLALVILINIFTLYAATVPQKEARIVGGHEAIPHSHPYQVSLQLRFLFLRVHLCGGTLLNENWVLTAGHCVALPWLLSWLPLDAVAGAHDVIDYGSNAQVITIQKRIPHPFYNGDIGPNDIALLKTKTPFEFTKQVQAVRLPSSDFKSDDVKSMVTLTGWGLLRTSFFPDMPRKLQEIQLPLISYEECYKAVDTIKEDGEANPLDKEANICTGPLTGGIAACNGDSGGPLVQYMQYMIDETTENIDQVNEENTTSHFDSSNTTEMIEVKENFENSTPTIIGVVSWGATPCGEVGAPTVYTKVSEYIDFIESHIFYD